MSEIIICGGERLHGEVTAHGAKNSALPILAATLVPKGESVIHNCPCLSDVTAACEILRTLGCRVSRSGGTVSVDSSCLTECSVPERLMREMRSSISFLGAVLARTGSAELTFPGGCELGPRPIDLHLSSLRRMGAHIEERHGRIHCRTSGGLKGADIALGFPSVGATENIMVAAATAKGRTKITNAAREPEISDLAVYLNRCGARISGYGSGTVTVEGVEKLHPAEHTVIPDRIETVTYMACAAMTGGDVYINNICTEHLTPVLQMLEETGCTIEEKESRLHIKAPETLLPLKMVRTMPYPGFPTDAQAIIMSLMTAANGTSVFVETIFDDRYKHVSELCRMGAKIKTDGRVAVVEGVPKLFGAKVVASDLRGAAALITAGLAAEGTTRVENLRHLDRGYEAFESGLSALGAKIKRT